MLKCPTRVKRYVCEGHTIPTNIYKSGSFNCHSSTKCSPIHLCFCRPKNRMTEPFSKKKSKAILTFNICQCACQKNHSFLVFMSYATIACIDYKNNESDQRNLIVVQILVVRCITIRPTPIRILKYHLPLR